MWGEVSGAGQGHSEALVTPFSSTTGGVMTVEVGAITGELELLTRPAAEQEAIEAMVRYAGARDLYTVAGSPVHTTGAKSYEDTHEQVLERLTTPGPVRDSNELPVDLSDI